MPDPASDDLCIRCGYDLSGLGTEGLCPECALPIAASRERSPLLRGADREWLGSIAAGLRGIDRAMWAILGVLVATIGSTVLAVFIAALVPATFATGDRVINIVAGVVALAGVALTAALHAHGCWRLGTPTPGDYAPPERARLALRTCGPLLPLGGGILLFWRELLRPLPAPGLLIAAVLIQAVTIAFGLSLGHVMEHLERRTPGWSPGLAKKHTNFRKNLWGVAVILALIDAGGNTREVPGFTIAVLGLTYMVMDSAIARVRRAVQLELAIAQASAPAPES